MRRENGLGLVLRQRSVGFGEKERNRDQPGHDEGEGAVPPDRQGLRVARLRSHRLRPAPEDQGDAEEENDRADDGEDDEERRHLPGRLDLPLNRLRRHRSAALLETFLDRVADRAVEVDLRRDELERDSGDDDAQEQRQPPRRARDEPPERLGRLREGADDRLDGADARGGRRSRSGRGEVAHLTAPSSAGVASIETDRPVRTTFFWGRRSPMALCQATRDLR